MQICKENVLHDHKYSIIFLNLTDCVLHSNVLGLLCLLQPQWWRHSTRAVCTLSHNRPGYSASFPRAELVHLLLKKEWEREGRIRMNSAGGAEEKWTSARRFMGDRNSWWPWRVHYFERCPNEERHRLTTVHHSRLVGHLRSSSAIVWWVV